MRIEGGLEEKDLEAGFEFAKVRLLVGAQRATAMGLTKVFGDVGRAH